MDAKAGHIPLASLRVIATLLPSIKSSRDQVIEDMESMVISGLANLDQPLLSTSLQTSYNMRLLPQLVGNLLADLNEAVEGRVAKVFDIESMGKEVAQKGESVKPSEQTHWTYSDAVLGIRTTFGRIGCHFSFVQVKPVKSLFHTNQCQS